MKLCFFYDWFKSALVRDLLLETALRVGLVPSDDFITGGALASLRLRVVTVGILESTGSFLVPQFFRRLLP